MFPRRKKQAGNLYIVAIFVIVVMGFLAAAITRMEWSNQDSLSRELLGTKAWFAANSVNEKALTLLYPLNATSSAVSSACGVWGSSSASEVMASYDQCQVKTTCKNEGTLELSNKTYYRIESAVTCGSDQFEVRRVQDVWVKE